jgi:hypothetical protein
MRKLRIGPTLGLVTLLVIAVLGVFSSPPLTVSKPSQATNQHHISQATENEHPSLFFTVWAWARDNRDVIEPLAALGALAVAAVVAYATFLLFGATKRLAISTDELARGAHEQSLEMALARALTEKTLDLEERQFLLAGKQTDLAEKQHGLQREQYLAEHRPRLRIRSVGVVQPIGRNALSDQILRGSLVLVNIGASEATIKEAHYRFFSGPNGLPMVPPLEASQVRPLFGGSLPYKMAGHESCLIAIESRGPLDDIATGIGFNGLTDIYVMGAIRFSDWNLQDRWMGFCQKYMPSEEGGEGRFLSVDNPNYEYED